MRFQWSPQNSARASAVLAALVGISPAHGLSPCDSYRDRSTTLYEAICTNGRSEAKPAGASSTFSSEFNLSAASLPSEPTSYGLETLVSRLRTAPNSVSPTFSLIKGFNKFGTGISTGGNDTFYGDDVIRRRYGSAEVTTFDPPEPARSKLPNLNLGTSVDVFTPPRGPAFKLGLSLRYNQITNTWGGGPAAVLASPHFTMGAAYTQERISNALPRIRFTSFQVSTRWSLFEFEYNQLRNDSFFRQTPIHIVTLTTTVSGLILTVARRRLEFANENDGQAIYQTHLALQYLFSKRFSAGALYNYTPGATSLGVQVFL